MMNTLYKISIPVVVAFSFMLLLNASGSTNIYGQIIGNTTQANQTSITNQTTSSPQQSNQTYGENQTANTQQAQQQIQQADKQMNQAQQQKQQAQQQLEKSQSKNMTALSEKLLNFTNAAITSLNNNHDDDAMQSLSQMQSYLINATGKQVVVMPSSSDGGSSK